MSYLMPGTHDKRGRSQNFKEQIVGPFVTIELSVVRHYEVAICC